MKLNFFKHNFSNKKANRILALLISLDLLFILTHIILIFLVFKRIHLGWSIVPFMVERDAGYPEMFQYLKYAVVIVLLFYLLLKKRGIGYISWLLLFILLLLDDSLQFHERFGAWAVEKFSFAPTLGLRAQDIGELTYVAIFGSISLFFLVFGYVKGDKKYRKINIDLALLFGVFLFFGIGVDMLDELVEYNRYSLLFLVLFEDGGEMITLSLVLWYFCYLILKPQNHDKYLFQFFFKHKKPID